MPGRPPRVSDAEILAVFEQVDQPCVGTQHVAQRVDLSYQGTKSRLDGLDADGLVDSCVIGTARAWWLTPDGEAEVWDWQD